MKKKILLTLSLLIASAAYAASTYTTYYSLEKPSDGDSNWGSAYRTSLNTIDSTLNSLATDTANHLADTVGAHAATAISTSVGGIVCTSAITVQAFLDCLDLSVGAITGGTVMTLDTNQTVTGTKTFSSIPVFSNGFTSDAAPTVSVFGAGVVHSDASGLLSSSLVASADITDGTIVNDDINASAAITRSKLASGTADHVIINNGSGVMSSEAQLASTRGGTGVSNAGTLTYGSNNITLTTSGATSLTLPTSGTVVTLDGISTLSNKTFSDSPVMLSTVSLKETGGGSDVIQIGAPAVSASYTVTMPAAAPTANTALAYDGSNYVWSSAGGWTMYSNENISASGSVTTSTTVGQQVRRVTGNGAAVTASTTPFGAGGGWSDGLVVRLIGQSSTNTVTIVNNDAAKGAILNGDITLGQYDVLELQYDSTADRWIEVSRSVK
jgi:hypothetical protein